MPTTAPHVRYWPATAWLCQIEHRRPQSPADRPPRRDQSRTRSHQQIKDLLITAPAELRERYRRYTTNLRLVEALARRQPTAQEDPISVAVLIAAKALAQRIVFLDAKTAS